MRSWNLNELEVDVHQPEVIHSAAEGRAIVINLPAGERLQQHQVHERTWLLVTAGEIVIDGSGGEETGVAGYLAEFDPNERREVRATADSRILLLLSPWPGEGHPSAAG